MHDIGPELSDGCQSSAEVAALKKTLTQRDNEISIRQLWAGCHWHPPLAGVKDVVMLWGRSYCLGACHGL